jgi:hypothetical protein
LPNMKYEFYFFFHKLFPLSKQLWICSLHMNIDGSYTIISLYLIRTWQRADFCIKILLDVYLDLQMMHCNTCNFTKSISSSSLMTKSLIDKPTTMKYPNCNLCFYKRELQNINI